MRKLRLTGGRDSLSTTAQVRDTAQTHTRFSKLPVSHRVSWASCVGKRGCCVKRRTCWVGFCCYQRKEKSNGTRDKNSEGSVGVRHAAEPSSASGTHIYSNHTLCAGLAALNYAPQKGLSSHQGFDTSLPGCLCWAMIWSPEQFRARRQRRQMEIPGTFPFLRTLPTCFLLTPRLVGQAA